MCALLFTFISSYNDAQIVELKRDLTFTVKYWMPILWPTAKVPSIVCTHL